VRPVTTDQIRVRITVTVADGHGRTSRRSSLIERIETAVSDTRMKTFASNEVETLIDAALREVRR
jgi:hypothetical protein